MDPARSTVLYLDPDSTTFDPLPATVYRSEWTKVGGWLPPRDRPAPTLGRDEIDLVVHRPSGSNTWLYGVRKGTEPGCWMQPAYPPLHRPEPAKTVLWRPPHNPTYPIYDLRPATIYRSAEGTLPGWQSRPDGAAELVGDEVDLRVHSLSGARWVYGVRKGTEPETWMWPLFPPPRFAGRGRAAAPTPPGHHVGGGDVPCG